MKILYDFEIDEILNQLNLDLLERHYPHWNFRCPICGDSKKSRTKKRGWIKRKSNNSGYYFICYNCGNILSVSQFVKTVNEDIYKKYFKPTLDDIQNILKPKINQKENLISKALVLFKLNKYFINISDREKNYLQLRKIPEKYWNLFRVYNNPKSIIHNFLMIPFWYKNTGKVYGYQGRNILHKEFRTYVASKGYKVYNLFNIDPQKDVYIFEAIFDSMMIDNSIAIIGADFSNELLLKYIPKENQIFIYDNDETGYIHTIELLKQNYKCLIYPKDFSYKDINDAVKNNYLSIQEVKNFIQSNIGNKENIFDLKLRLKLF